LPKGVCAQPTMQASEAPVLVLSDMLWSSSRAWRRDRAAGSAIQRGWRLLEKACLVQER
jgi:hypothetical protein